MSMMPPDSGNENLNSNGPRGKPKGEKAASELGLPKIIHFNSLVRCGDEIWIECEGQIYRLRRTKQGKLVLTK